MLDKRDKYNQSEENILSINGKKLVINRYLPENVNFISPKEDDLIPLAGSPKWASKNKDKTITKKEKSWRLIIVGIAVLLMVGLIWMMMFKKPHKKSISLIDPQAKQLTQTKSFTITEEQIESTITGRPRSSKYSRKSSKKNVKVGDKVTYKDKEEDKKSHNYNTPLYIKAISSSYGSTSGIRAPKLPIPKNSYIRVYLEREVTSGNMSIPVTAIAYVDLTYNGKVLIPKDSKLIGKTNYSGGNRVGMAFNLVIFPNGKEYAIRGVALGEDNVAGIPGNVDYRLAKKGASIFASSLLNATSSTLSVTGDSFGSIFAGNMAGSSSDSLDNAIEYGSRSNGMKISVPMNLRFKISFL